MTRRRNGRRAARPEILAVIPVSGQDPEFRRGLPRLGRRSLLDFTFAAAKDARRVTRTLVTTDDRRIAEVARRAGIDVPFVRPKSSRRAPIADVLEQAVEFLEKKEPGYSPDWIVRLQVTFPFRDRGMIDRAIATVLAQDLDSAFMAFPEYDTFWYINGGAPERITTDTRVPRAKRRPIYRELGGLFSMVRRDVLARGTLHGDKLGILPSEAVTSAVDLHGVHGQDLASLIAATELTDRLVTTRRPTLADFTSRLTELAAAIAARDPEGVDYTLRLAVAETLYLFHDRLRSEERALDRAAFLTRLDQARVMVDRLDAVRPAPGVARVERPPYEIYVADLYSRCWAKYDDEQFDATIDMFAERFTLNGVSLDRFKGAEALDAGCGSGRYTMAMAKLGAGHAHGVDLSERAVREAAARARRMGYGDRVSFAQRSVIDLPADWTGRFDFVCSNGVVHHTPDPVKGVEEIARVLKPGGEAFIMVYGKGGSFWALTDFCREILMPVPLDVADAYLELRGTPVGKIFFCLDHWYTQYQERVTLKEFESRLANAGFTKIRYLPRARVYDASERLARYPEEADIIEDPDMRYLARKA